MLIMAASRAEEEKNKPASTKRSAGASTGLYEELPSSGSASEQVNSLKTLPSPVPLKVINVIKNEFTF